MTQAKFYENEEKEDFYNEDEEELRPPRRPGEAPDGAWGWMVVFGACVCCIFVQGLISSSRFVLSSELEEYFQLDEGSLSDINVILRTFSLTGGPLICVLAKKFSCRKIVMAGSVVVCGGLLVSTQMPGPGTIRLTLGAITGLGLSMVYQPSIVIVASWFEKRRAFATGLAAMGSGIGVFVVPQVYKHLLDTLDWKNASTIMAALFLNTAVAGALYRSLTHAKPKGMKRGPIQHGAIMKALIAEKERQRTISNGSLDNCIITRDNRLIKIDKIDLRNKSNTYINRLKETFGFSSRSLNRSKNSLVVPKVVVDPIYRKSPRASNNRLFTPKASTSPPTPKRDSGCGSLEGSPTGKQVSRSYEALPLDDVNENWDRNLVVKLPPKEAASSSDRNINLNNLDSKHSSPKRFLDDNNLDPSFLSNNVSPVGSVRSINARSPSLVSQSSRATEIYLPKQGSVMTITGVRSEMSTIMEEPEDPNCKLLHLLSKVLDLKLLKLPSFWLLILIGFLTMIGEAIPFVHLPNRAVAMGASQNKANFLISYHWVLGMIGRFVFGWVADRPWASAVQLNNAMILLAGVLSFFTHFYNNYSWLAFYASLFGFLTSAFFTLRSIMLIELFGKKRLSSSFGLLTFFHGIAVFVGYKFTGILHGEGAFYLVGLLLLCAGLFGMLLPKVKVWETNRETRRENRLEVVRIEEIEPPETYKIENCESTI